MDISKLSGQFATDQTFPQIVHIPASVEAARKAQHENDWSQVLEEQRHPEFDNLAEDDAHRTLFAGIRISGPKPGDGDPYEISMDAAHSRAITDAMHRGHAAEQQERNATGTASRSSLRDSGVVIRAILHPKNPVRSDDSYVPTPKPGPRGGKPKAAPRAYVSDSSLPYHDVWEQVGQFDEPGEPGTFVVTRPDTALTVHSVLGPFPDTDIYGKQLGPSRREGRG